MKFLAMTINFEGGFFMTLNHPFDPFVFILSQLVFPTKELSVTPLWNEQQAYIVDWKINSVVRRLPDHVQFFEK